MDIESLKMVAQIVQNLAASGKEAFIWYLMVQFVLPQIIGALNIFAVAYAMFRIVKLGCERWQMQQSYTKAESAAHDAMCELGKLMGVPGFEYMPSANDISLLKHNIIAAVGSAAMKKKESEK